MSAVVHELLDLLHRQRDIDALSPAARVLEQRSIDERARQIEARTEPNVRPLLLRAMPRLEAMLAGQGDRADPSLVQLQHDLTEYLNTPPF